MDSSAAAAGLPAASRLDRGVVVLARVGAALLWMGGASWKQPPRFEGLHQWTSYGYQRPVLAPWAWLVQHVVLPNFTFFGWLTLALEASLGAFLLIGLATRFWAVIGAGQTVVITLTALHAPHEWVWSYLLMLLLHLMLFATAAGRYGGVDAVLRPRWIASRTRVARLLVWAS